MHFFRALFTLTYFAVSAPNPPYWPASFNVSFDEQTYAKPIIQGSWAYDYTNLRQRIDRSSGLNDRYCGSVKSLDAPCIHLVINSSRYLIWPQQKFCCSCCTAEEGCGIVKPSWMVDNKGVFENTSQVITPVWTGQKKYAHMLRFYCKRSKKIVIR